MKAKQFDSPLTCEQGIGLLVAESERRGRVLIEMLLDPRHLNGESGEYKAALQEFHAANQAVFRWKCAWQEIVMATKEIRSAGLE